MRPTCTERRAASRLAPRALVATACAALAAVAPARAAAQGGGERVMLQGIADAEVWATDSGSTLLTRNNGGVSPLGRLQMWTAWEPWRGLVAFAEARVEGGPASTDAQPREIYLDHYGVRWAPSPALVVDAGRMPNPVGAFASRRFSTRNPLIGQPDGYPVRYPYGAQLSGAAGIVDYRLAMVSGPVAHPDYVPEPDRAWRPALGGGITPVVGIRVGASATWGPYLNHAYSAAQLDSRRWQSYQQRVVALDAHFSRGYLETHAELARGSYDVPARANAVTGWTYYVEGKYTTTPRLFVAARLERNDYPFIRPTAGRVWVANVTDFSDAEVGVGYRLSESTLLKVSTRTDWWEKRVRVAGFSRNGRALAMQLSRSFDVLEMVRRDE